MSTPGSVLERQPVDLSLVQPYEITSQDGLITHRVHADTSNQDFTRITTETCFPEGMEGEVIKISLDPVPFDQQSDDDPQSELIRLTVPARDLSRFCNVQRFATVLHALGYEWDTGATSEHLVTTHRTAFTYPSIDRFNAVAQQIFPSTPLLLASFDGGRYTTADYLTPLAEDGEIVVPSEQPWQLHEHVVKHLLGLMAMGEDFVEPLRDVIKQWLVRNKAEAALPTVPGMDSEQIEQFLRPARTILGLLMKKFDSTTGEIADMVLVDKIRESRYESSQRWDDLTFTLGQFWDDGESGYGRGREIPRGFMGEQGGNFFNKAARTMWERFEIAEDNAVLMLNKGV